MMMKKAMPCPGAQGVHTAKNAEKVPSRMIRMSCFMLFLLVLRSMRGCYALAEQRIGIHRRIMGNTRRDASCN